MQPTDRGGGVSKTIQKKHLATFARSNIFSQLELKSDFADVIYRGPPKYLQIQPSGVASALSANRQVLVESTAYYLCDLK